MKVVVIGAGILGASTAYRLAKRGADVVLIDRKDKGQATDAAAGIICPWLTQRRNQAWYRLAKAGARFYPELIAELRNEGETETGYSKVGSLHLHHDPDKLDKMMERAYMRLEDAPEIGDIKKCGEEDVRMRFPLLADGYHAVHVSGAARVDGRALRDALIRSARRYGAVLIEGNAELVGRCHRVIGAVVDGECYEADRVVVCAGAWARELLEPLGISFQVSYQKAQIMHVHVNEKGDTGNWPVVMPPSNQYLLAFHEGKVVIGATHEDHIEGYDTRVTAGGMQEILQKGLTVAPDLADSTFQEMRVGFRPFTPGFLPVIGAIPGWEGLLTANGIGASGLTVGPLLGEQLAKLALGLELDIELNDYDIRKAIE